MQYETIGSDKKRNGFGALKKTISYLGLISLTLYIFSSLSLHISAPPFFEYFFVLAFFIGIFFRPWQLKNDIALRLVFLAFVFPLISFGINYLSNPSLAEKYFLFENLLRLMTFSAVGFWLAIKPRYVYIFLLLVLLSSIAAIFNVDIIENFKDIFSGKRVDSGIGNSQYTANLFGILIIGLICLFKDFFSYVKQRSSPFIYLAAYLLCLTLCLTVFLGSQTRTALITIDLIYIISILHFLYLIKNRILSNWTKKIFFIYAVLSLTILSVNTFKIIEKRSQNDKAVIGQIVDKGFNNIKMTSLGIRINSWIEASNWIKEKPIHGWGGKANSDVLKSSNFPESIKKMGHLHNSYFEFTLAYGLAGLALIFYMFYWVNRQAYLLAKSKKKYESIWLYTFYGTLFTAGMSLFESHLYYSIGVYTTAILLAPAYGLYLSKLSVKANN